MKTIKLILFLLTVTLMYLTVLKAKENTASDEPSVIRVKSLELVDDIGQVRASLLVESNGETVLRLKDSKGEIRVKIGASETGSGLLLLNGNTNPGIHALANSNSTQITITDTSGNKRLLKP